MTRVSMGFRWGPAPRQDRKAGAPHASVRVCMRYLMHEKHEVHMPDEGMAHRTAWPHVRVWRMQERSDVRREHGPEAAAQGASERQ